MAKLPPIEVKALWALEELHKGKPHREKALSFLREAGDGPLARELRDTVNRRGRQPFGGTHRWWDIGVDNDDLVLQGMDYDDRCVVLGHKFMLNPRQIESALAKYNRAVDEIRAIAEENRDQ